MLPPSRIRPPSRSPAPYRPLARLVLLLGGLFLIAPGCAQQPHEPGQAHDPVRTVHRAQPVTGQPTTEQPATGQPTTEQPATGQPPRAETPAESCSPAGSHTGPVVRQHARTPVFATAAPDTTTAHAPPPAEAVRTAPAELRRSTSGRFTLCRLCRLRT
ncbi:hypothetical protein [Streptomyces sp. CB03238]|uniref:hypothetical protein n=1 Tax=Streptomyces sp. CB03238 TaxID=1907777 RepID=UPI000A121102|nr:hypothetical protein [Streptomyces sp. CB03238]ORT55619.1 hypothetical protein BKD26_31420 [Streptomyces sp. CB03238]